MHTTAFTIEDCDGSSMFGYMRRSAGSSDAALDFHGDPTATNLTLPRYELEVVATDEYGLNATIEVDVLVLDVDEPP